MKLEEFFNLSEAKTKQDKMSFVAVQVYQLCKASHRLGSRADISILNLMRHPEEYAEIKSENKSKTSELHELLGVQPAPNVRIKITSNGRVDLTHEDESGSSNKDMFFLNTRKSGKEMLEQFVRYAVADPKGIFKNSVYNFSRGVTSAPVQRVDLF